MNLRDRIILWLNKRKIEDIVYVKRNPDFDIFLAHPGTSRFDVYQLITEPEKIIDVLVSESHNDRLIVIKIYSKGLDYHFIILDPFNENIEKRFLDKIAIVTFYPVRKQLR